MIFASGSNTKDKYMFISHSADKHIYLLMEIQKKTIMYFALTVERKSKLHIISRKESSYEFNNTKFKYNNVT